VGNKCVFLDKDGTLVKEVHHMTDESQLEIIPGSPEAIKILRDIGYLIIVVTNQSVVGRGMITEDKLRRIMDTMKSMFLEEGAVIDRIYYCPHHPADGCPCRKPNSLLYEQARKDFNLDFTKCYVIGDSFCDIFAGKKIGARTILVLTGHGQEIHNLYSFPDIIAADLYEAAIIIKGMSEG